MIRDLVLFAVLTTATIRGVIGFGHHLARTTEKRTGAACLTLWAMQVDLPALMDGEIRTRQGRLFGEHIVACLPRAADVRERLQHIQDEADEHFRIRVGGY